MVRIKGSSLLVLSSVRFQGQRETVSGGWFSLTFSFQTSRAAFFSDYVDLSRNKTPALLLHPVNHSLEIMEIYHKLAKIAFTLFRVIGVRLIAHGYNNYPN